MVNNNVSLIGNLAGNPLLVSSPSGPPMLLCKLVVDRKVAVRRARWAKGTANVFNLVIPGDTNNPDTNPEMLNKFLQKGSQIAIQGELATRQITLPGSDEVVIVVEVIVDSIKFLANIRNPNKPTEETGTPLKE